MFKKIILDERFTFDELCKDISFEDLGKYRKGAVIADITDNTVPIVRTTTKYREPVQCTTDPIKKLKNAIVKLDSSLDFNNAMVEIYESGYKKMKYHTDQALDLQQDSNICLFSCYEDPDSSPRKLIVRDKISGKETIHIMENNSIIIFSTDWNRKYQHKIVGSNLTERWLGITFRLSKTFIDYTNTPIFKNTGDPLLLATEDEANEFYKLKNIENSTIDHCYCHIPFTISKSDLTIR